MGNINKITLSDIPLQHRKNKEIRSQLDYLKSNFVSNQEKNTEKIREKLYESLIEGNLKKSFKIYSSFSESNPIHNFYNKILRPVMYKIGDDWEQNLISVSNEHVSSNCAHSLVNAITQDQAKHPSKNKILICTPSGEEHNLGCKIIESALTIKGNMVFNISPSAPSKSIIEFVEEHNPDIILVSITLKDNIRSGQRLVKKISSFKIPIFVGGQALVDSKREFEANTVQDISLEKLVKLVQDTIKHRRFN